MPYQCPENRWVVPGAYHVGVEAASDSFLQGEPVLEFQFVQHVVFFCQVYWLEWSFGWCEEGSGVYMVAS